MVTKTQAIENWVRSQLPTHNDPGLPQLWLDLGGCAMETQVVVHQADGEPVDEGRPGRYTDGLNTWGPIRIPYNAATTPLFEDSPMYFALDRYADSIGWTGFNWREQKSYFVGFDFDGLTHKQGLAPEVLAEVRQHICNLDYVTLRRSTSGTGWHVYAMLDGLPCRNHREHSRIAESVLKRMSKDAGFDFSSSVDCFGAVLWFWSRRATKENRGFELMKGES